MRRSAVRIGAQVSVISALLVLAVFGMFAGYLALQANGTEALEPHDGDIRFAIDPWQLVVGLGGLGVFAIGLAGVATWLIARRAVAPIGQALRMQRTFVADASHELRTPLTVIGARVQQLERQADDPEARARVLGELRRDTRSMNAIVDDLLTAVALERTGDAGTAAAELRDVLDEAVGSLEPVATPKGVRFSVAGGVDGRGVRMPVAVLRRCLTILLDNAVAHARVDGRVSVTLRPDRRAVAIDVADDGAGIRGIDPDRVFDRFAHGTPTDLDPGHRTGSGIGLALLAELAGRHDARIRVASTSAAGTVFTLRLLRAPSRSSQRRTVCGTRH